MFHCAFMFRLKGLAGHDVKRKALPIISLTRADFCSVDERADVEVAEHILVSDDERKRVILDHRVESVLFSDLRHDLPDAFDLFVIRHRHVNDKTAAAERLRNLVHRLVADENDSTSEFE